MSKTTFFLVYLLTATSCLLLVVGIIRLLSKGLTHFFQMLYQEAEVSGFFTRMIQFILLFAALGGALSHGYVMEDGKASWLTLSWDAIDQLRETLNGLYTSLIILGITFLFLLFLDKRFSK